MEVPESHWVRWHRAYDVAGSPLQHRLAIVNELLTDAIDQGPDRVLKILSLCAGQGRDVLDVLGTHVRGRSTTARLVDTDAELMADASARAHRAGLANVEMLVADAGVTDVAEGFAPVDVMVACGIFGNISAADIERFIGFLPTLCGEGATVLWTRHRRPPDLTPTIRGWFSDAGFREVSFHAPDADGLVSVGAHRMVAEPQRFRPGIRLFDFVGDGSAY